MLTFAERGRRRFSTVKCQDWFNGVDHRRSSDKGILSPCNVYCTVVCESCFARFLSFFDVFTNFVILEIVETLYVLGWRVPRTNRRGKAYPRDGWQDRPDANRRSGRETHKGE